MCMVEGFVRLSDPGSCVVEGFSLDNLVSRKKPDLERLLKTRWSELCPLSQIMATCATYMA